MSCNGHWEGLGFLLDIKKKKKWELLKCIQNNEFLVA